MRSALDHQTPRNRYLMPAAGTTVLSAVVLVVAYANDAALAIAAVGLVSCVQWMILKRVTAQPLPLAGIVIVGLNMVGVTGWFFYPKVAAHAAVSAAFSDSPEVYNLSAVIFITISASIFVGALLARNRAAAINPGIRDQIRVAMSTAASISGRKLILASSATILIEVMAYTPTALWSRERYSSAAGPVVLRSIGGLLMPIGLVIAALLLFHGAATVRRAGAWLMLTYSVLIFALGSRQLALIPLMTLMMYLARPRKPNSSGVARFVAVPLALVASLMMLQLPLALRGNPGGAGLGPHTQVVWRDPGILVSTAGLQGPIGNVLFAVPLAGTTGQLEPRFPAHYLVTSVSPLPGSMTDWETIKWHMRINAFTPTNAIGELWNFGPWWLVGFGLALGFGLTSLQRWNGYLAPGMAALTAVAGVGMAGGFALGLLQYNLRGDLRQLWYFTFVSVVAHLVPAVRSRRRP